MSIVIHFGFVGPISQANIAHLATLIQIRIPANNNKYKLLLKVIDETLFKVVIFQTHKSFKLFIVVC